MTDAEKYKLSTYLPVELLRQTKSGSVEIVKCSLDEQLYIKKAYHSDKREIFRILSSVDSPFLPKIHDTFFSEDTIVIEEYIEGCTLAELCAEGKSFSKRDVKKIVESMVQAIAAIHEAGVIHRDIKPSNIIVREDGQAVLIDFSIARLYSANTTADTELLGTIGYAAPEQFGFSQSDYRTDIYAFGQAMSEIVTRKNASPALFRAIHRCAEFDPLRRFQTISEFRSYLRRKNQLAILGILFGVAVLLVTVVLFVNPQQSPAVDSSPDSTSVFSNQHSLEFPKPSEEHIAQDEQSPGSVSAEQDAFAKILYEPRGDRIVDTSSASDIPCIKAVEGETLRTEVLLADTLKPVLIEIRKEGSQLSVTIDASFSTILVDDGSIEAVDYPNGEPMAEVILYDLNGDGILDIIPVLTNAITVDYLNNGNVSLLKNYSIAWCIFYSDGSYQLAEGQMQSRYENFKIYDSAPGCLWADFPSFFTMQDGSVVLKQ